MYIVVYVTVPSLEVGKKIAKKILEERLAACVNIKPEIVSMYWWEDKIQDEPEALMIIKTKLGLFHELETLVKDEHPYKVPEIIAMPILTGFKPYLSWISDETRFAKDDASMRGIIF